MTAQEAARKQLTSRVDILIELYGLFGPDLRLRKILGCLYKRVVQPNRASTREVSCLGELLETNTRGG